jgi:hypothetical protein
VPLALGAAVGFALAVTSIRIGLLVRAIGERKGVPRGVLAALGVAAVDSGYAWLATGIGSATAGATGTARVLLDTIAAGVLLGVAGRELIWRLMLGPTGIPPNAVLQDSYLRTVAQAAVIRALQPIVFVTLAAASIGLPQAVGEPADRTAFLVGLVGVSLAGRLVLVAAGWTGRRLGWRRLSRPDQRALSIAGAGTQIGLAIGIATRTL